MPASPPLRAPSLEGLSGVVHHFSRALRTPEDHARLEQTSGLGAPPLRLRQVHGACVVRAIGVPPFAQEGDALVTDRPGLPVAVATADCVPILLADPDARIVGAVHAGWRGMRSRVVLRSIEAMVALGAEPERLRAAIGPCIQGACYEVGPEVRAAFEETFPDAASLFDGKRLDLVRAARAELGLAGVVLVSSLDLCTHCSPDLASYRREGSARGTNLAAIALV